MIHGKTASTTTVLISLVLLAACSGTNSGSGVAAGSSGAPASDCKPAHQVTTIKKGSLTVTGEELPPFGHVGNDGISGVDGDILAAIAKKECLKIVPMPVAAAAVIPTVQSGRADVAMGDWNRTNARVQIVNMSDPIYIDQMALVSKAGLTQVAQLKGQSVGTVTGYLWVDDLKKQLNGKLKLYSSNVQMYADLKVGRLDVGIDGLGPAAYSSKGTPFKVVAAEADPAVAVTLNAPQTGFPVTKSNTSLLGAINADIAELKAQGQIVVILAKYDLPKSASDTGAARLIG